MPTSEPLVIDYFVPIVTRQLEFMAIVMVGSEYVDKIQSINLVFMMAHITEIIEKYNQVKVGLT